MKTILRYAAGFLVLGLLWHAGSVLLGEELLPRPVATTALFLERLATAEFWGHIGISFARLLAGLFVGAPARASHGALAAL